ncbi:GNAT family N-acetyltransferase [Nisaea sp.]|uniref:GNAT family N-acetyltransferase n=1 Tax=Nisaea sp. TaxID=2024842 RepID=UPI002B27177B|nr:GNAT family N-acetyltransferase [Nisaea sp.]
MAPRRILRLTDAPHHLDTVVAWNHAEWGVTAGRSLSVTEGWFQDMIRKPSEECVIAERDGVALGIACLVDHDLEERPDLLHWLASVYVDPAFRRTGLGSALVGAVEREAAARNIKHLHLYTHTAEPLYQRLGWTVSERFNLDEDAFALMIKDPRG